MSFITKPLKEQQRAWRLRLLRVYYKHACIGVPLVLAGSLYITYMVSGYVLPGLASTAWAYFCLLGGLAAFLAPLPMALSEMDHYPTQQRLKKLNALNSADAELKQQDPADGPVETDK